MFFSKVNRINTQRSGSQLATTSTVLQTLLAFQGSQGSHSTNKHQGTVTYQVTADTCPTLFVILSHPETSLGLCLLADIFKASWTDSWCSFMKTDILCSLLFIKLLKSYFKFLIFSVMQLKLHFICISGWIVHTLSSTHLTHNSAGAIFTQTYWFTLRKHH